MKKDTDSFHFLNIQIPNAAATTIVPTTIAPVTTLALEPPSWPFELLLLGLGPSVAVGSSVGTGSVVVVIVSVTTFPSAFDDTEVMTCVLGGGFDEPAAGADVVGPGLLVG